MKRWKRIPWTRGSFTDTERGQRMCGILGLAKKEDSFKEALKLKIHRSNKQTNKIKICRYVAPK